MEAVAVYPQLTHRRPLGHRALKAWEGLAVEGTALYRNGLYAEAITKFRAAYAVTEDVQRARELFVQAASETLDDDERAYLSDEYQQILEEIDRAAIHMEFNGVGLNGNDFIVQIGAQNDPDHQLIIAIDSMLVGGILEVAVAEGACSGVEESRGAAMGLLQIRS